MKDKLEQAKWVGILKIGDMELPCSVLADGTRLLTEANFMNSLGMYRSGALSIRREKNKDGEQTPLYLAFKNLEPYIATHIGNPHHLILKYKTENGLVAHGIKAESIPKICDVWLDAQDDGVLGDTQEKIANKAKLLMRGLAHVGIIALVDEATGYQNAREHDALQKIIDKFLKGDAHKWSKTFPDEFWQKLLKIKGYPSYMAVSRPAFVGHWVNDIIYDRLAPGISKKLKDINPRTDKGHRKYKHHQHLTEDHGVPELKEHLAKVMVLMDAASSSEEFDKLLNKSLTKYGDTLPLDI